MKKLALAVTASLICLAILLPVIGSFNHLIIIPASHAEVYRAYGAPMPPPIPPGFVANSDAKSQLVADGAPMPPPIPPGYSTVTAVA